MGLLRITSVNNELFSLVGACSCPIRDRCARSSLPEHRPCLQLVQGSIDLIHCTHPRTEEWRRRVMPLTRRVITAVVSVSWSSRVESEGVSVATQLQAFQGSVSQQAYL